MEKLINFITENATTISEITLLVYEILIRLFPTKRNLSIIDTVFKIISFLIPNNKKKVVPVIAFMLLSLAASAQLNGNFKSVRLTVNDTTATTEINGTIIYNTPTQQFYGYENFQWKPIIGGGGGDSTYVPFVYPEDYGAVGDGSTNDAAAITAAVATGLPVYFSKKNYRVNSTINIPSNTQILGSGRGSIISTTSNISIFTLTGDNSDISHITFLGNDAGAVQDGINAVGNAGLTLFRISNRITNCVFQDLNRAGIYVQDMIGSPSTNHQGAIYAVNCVAVSCNNGYYMASRGEYNTFANCVAYTCVNGAQIIGGNNNFVGGQFTDNQTGIRFGTGTNDGHGVISGCKINHNTTNVFSNGLVQGFLFSGCMLYAGNVSLVSSAGMRFEGCEFSTVVFTITNSTPTEFTNNKFITTPTFTITGTTPIFFNNTFIAGTIPTAVTNTIVGKFFTAPTATLAGYNTGSFAGDPSTLANGDLWYNSTSNSLRARINGVSVSLGVGSSVNFSTNSRIPLMNTANTNFTYSPFLSYSTADNTLKAANLTLGDSSGVQEAIINVSSSAVNSALYFSTKGAGGYRFLGTGWENRFLEVGYEAGSGIVFVTPSNNSTFNIQPGVSTTGESGTDINIYGGGAATGSNVDGGTVSLIAGAPDGTGIPGDIIIDRSNGNLIIPNLPTSSAGLPSGTVWSNSGVLNIVP